VAADPDLTYLKVKKGGETLVIAEERAAEVLGEDFEVRERMKGRDLVGLSYRPPFDFLKPEGRAYVVVAADFVTAEDGTGLVHTAPAFGEDDYNLGRAEGLAFVNPVEEDGSFSADVPPWKGRFVIEANDDIIEDLRARGVLYESGRVTHTYPFCWRCDSPLVYYAHPSWYVKTTEFKDRMVELNRTIDWHPPEYGHNRFGRWLENNVDWALSRERYWGTPLNVWMCESCSARRCVGSVQELKELAVEMRGEVDLHRPWVDGVELKCDCGGRMKRTPEVIDCWFDTGGMPYAQYHWPFENRELFESQFPADFICEAVDQTRGWFYSMLAISTFMSDRPSFKSVIVTDLVLDAEGQKMSKSRGNAVDPMALLDRTGADPLRWYFYASSPVWLPTRFSVEQVTEVARKLLGTLRNVHSFFALYANIDCFDPRRHQLAVGERPLMDRWLISRLNTLIGYVDEELSRYEVTRPARAIQDFVIDDLSNWYVRRCRRRFWRHEMNEDKRAAYSTLYETLLALSRLAAPFLPFVAEEIYRHLMIPVDPEAPESVHLADYPEPDRDLEDSELERAMESVMRGVSLIRAARNRANIKVKQPLGEVKLRLGQKVDGGLLEELLSHLREEVNVKEVTLTGDISEYVTYEVTPRFDVLGPRLGGRVKALRPLLADLDMGAVRRLEAGAAIAVSLDGEEVELRPEEVEVRKTEREGFLFESDGTSSIVLDTEITPELLAEGCARELVSGIQNLRKKSGFDVTDGIRIHLKGGDMLKQTLELFGDHIKAETLAASVDGEMPDGAEPSEIKAGGEKVRVILERT
jgi:isoleucyl-tRNA synthetase